LQRQIINRQQVKQSLVKKTQQAITVAAPVVPSSEPIKKESNKMIDLRNVRGKNNKNNV
jgi:hypothetical protein